MKFTFQVEHFWQFDGMAISCPLGPLLADIFMGYAENFSEDSIQKMYLYKRYVDDIIVMGGRCEDVNRLLKELDTTQKHIFLNTK